MSLRKRLTAVGISAAFAALFVTGGVAAAAFPDFTGCPISSVPSHSACLDVQSLEGEVVIKGFRVPLDHSLEIRGALRAEDGLFFGATGTNGFIAQPVNVPGGLLGIELPIELNRVSATAELAGASSAIRVDIGEQTIAMPIKLRLSNPLIGSNCHIGSNSSPVNVRLIVGTTRPPAPNRPITGSPGVFELPGPPGLAVITNAINVDNAFSIPGANECGGLGLIDLLIDAKLKLPSAAGNNTMIIRNNIGLQFLP
jgi:hypothetical protein